MATDVHPAGTRRSVLSPGKWWRGREKRISASYQELIAAEARASRILHFHPVVVPGLLQTREYATAITSATILKPATREEIEMYVEVRMRRQREILDGSGSARVVFLIEEISIRRPVGSGRTMRAQLDHLVSMMHHPAVTLVLLPFQAPPHPGLTGAFMLIQYAKAKAPDVLCLEGAMGNVVIRDRPDLIAAYARLADRLMATGLSGDAAAQAIRSTRDEISHR